MRLYHQLILKEVIFIIIFFNHSSKYKQKIRKTKEK